MPSESFSVDLDLCAREPIHVPGHIQPFGVLLAIRTGDTRISQVSNNTELICGLPSNPDSRTEAG